MPQRDHSWEPLPKTASQVKEFISLPTPFMPDTEPRPKTQCEILGQASKPSHHGSPPTVNQVIPDEDLLDTLFRLCPQGQVVSLDMSSENESDSFFGSPDPDPPLNHGNTSSVARILGSLFPNAKSVVWLPLWDHQKSRWMAGMFSWSSDNHRGLGVEELHYFKVFANSIISEVSRIHWISTEKSKFDLLSSLSHELRSPLHGILASAELLHATEVNSSQEDMLKMIETSGLTLLETTDHLLTYCKINNSNRSKKLRGKQQENELLVLETDFDLGLLVEEVTSILYTGQKDPSIFTRSAFNSPLMGLPSSMEYFSNSLKPSVIVRVDQSHFWRIRSMPGAWRRIVMNILGNSLKWTARGMIEISLSMLKNPNASGDPLAHISIIDTGRGISAEFLRNDLFTPFTQEDRLVEGVGLGLSIVRQLVTSLNGHINVRSEMGLGTQVDIFIPVQQLDNDKGTGIPPNFTQYPRPLQVSLVAFNGYPDIKEAPTGMLTVEAKRKLSIQSMLADIFMSKTGWTVSLAETIEKGQGDIAVLESSTLEEIATPTSLADIASKNGFKFLIILKAKSSRLEKICLPNVIWIAPPFGPKKIQAAMEKVFDLHKSQTEFERMSSPVQMEAPDESTLIPVEESPLKPSVDMTSSMEIANEIPQPVEDFRNLSIKRLHHVLVVDDNEINLKVSSLDS